MWEWAARAAVLARQAVAPNTSYSCTRMRAAKLVRFCGACAICGRQCAQSYLARSSGAKIGSGYATPCSCFHHHASQAGHWCARITPAPVRQPHASWLCFAACRFACLVQPRCSDAILAYRIRRTTELGNNIRHQIYNSNANCRRIAILQTWAASFLTPCPLSPTMHTCMAKACALKHHCTPCTPTQTLLTPRQATPPNPGP